MKFYNLKTRSHVEIEDTDITKQKMISKTKSGGEQVRYAFKATYNGTTLYKFVNEAVYKSTNAKEG